MGKPIIQLHLKKCDNTFLKILKHRSNFCAENCRIFKVFGLLKGNNARKMRRRTKIQRAL